MTVDDHAKRNAIVVYFPTRLDIMITSTKQRTTEQIMKQVYTTGAQVDMNTWNVYVTDDFGFLVEVGFDGLAVYHPNLDLDM